MNVKPSDIIIYVRNVLTKRKIVSNDTVKRHQELYFQFQRVRWHMLQRCLSSDTSFLEESQWQQWLNTPVSISSKNVYLRNASTISGKIKKSLQQFGAAACFTCGECSSTCPICYERSVFDPQWILRMVNLGLGEDLIRSPAIWMCLGCQRCTNACSQLIKGHQIIEQLRKMAILEGFVANEFPLIWKNYQKMIYCHLLDEIDLLFGFEQKSEHRVKHEEMEKSEIPMAYVEVYDKIKDNFGAIHT
jgi:heterodisulfide reductase subunit C